MIFVESHCCVLSSGCSWSHHIWTLQRCMSNHMWELQSTLHRRERCRSNDWEASSLQRCPLSSNRKKFHGSKWRLCFRFVNVVRIELVIRFKIIPLSIICFSNLGNGKGGESIYGGTFRGKKCSVQFKLIQFYIQYSRWKFLSQAWKTIFIINGKQRERY